MSAHFSIECPFKPGARVAVFQGYSDGDVREAFVEKVHKNGNFTLRGDTSRQQWRPHSFNRNYGVQDTPSLEWSAVPTGERGFGRRRLKFWDARIDEEIQAAIDKSKRNRRLGVIQDRVRSLRVEGTATEMLDLIEAALGPAKNSAQP